MRLSLPAKESLISFYIYAHRRADTDAVFYIGKGTAKRAWATCRRSRAWQQLAAHGYTVHILEIFDSELAALKREVALIAELRAQGTQLVNMTAGGDGISGLVHTWEARARMAEAKEGKKTGPRPPEVRAKISKAHSGKPKGSPTPETRAKLSKALKGRRRVFGELHLQHLQEARDRKKLALSTS